MSRSFAILLAAHGIAHLPGFLVLWRLKTFPGTPYHTTLLSGHLEVGDAGARVMGLLFLLGALAFLAAGTAWWMGSPSRKEVVLAASLFSLALCSLAWPEARIGAFLDLGLLLALGILWTRAAS